MDGLRAVAILLVILCHLSHAKVVPAAFGLRSFFSRGIVGVDLFFVISGFLITLLLLRERRATNTISIKDFFIRRSMRILPAYAGFLAGLFLLTRLEGVSINSESWIGAITYTIGFLPQRSTLVTHTWSLAVEEYFYITWPVVVYFLGRRAWIWSCCCVFLSPVLRLVANRFFAAHIESHFCPITRMDGIAMGCCLAFVATNPALRHNIVFAHRRPYLTTVCLLALLVLGKCLIKMDKSVDAAFDFSLYAVFFTGILWVWVNSANSLLGRLLNSKGLAVIGGLSYSLYLWQQPFLTENEITERIGVSLFSVLLVVGTATASLLLIERPFLKLKDRFSGRQAASPSLGPAQTMPS